MAVCCRDFATKKGTEIMAKGLRNNFVLHLMNLFSFNLISSDCIKECVTIVDASLQKPKEMLQSQAN